MIFENLTIVTIGKSDDVDLLNTYNSILPVLNLGAKWILVIKQGDITEYKGIYLKIIGQDSGLYNALNLGMEAVDTGFFMFLHSGDRIFNIDGFTSSLDLLKNNSVGCVLGGAEIDLRKHHSYSWKPYMLKFYVQPPHLPIIYRTSSVQKLKFDESVKIVSDYYFLYSYFIEEKNSYIQSSQSYIRMNLGGATTSGLSSIFRVTRSFYQKDGIIAYLKLPFRLFIKILIQ
jgi:hypothetical protein